MIRACTHAKCQKCLLMSGSVLYFKLGHLESGPLINKNKVKKKVPCQGKKWLKHHTAADTAHIDYESEMILFIVDSDSAAGKTATNEKYRTVVNVCFSRMMN